VDASERSLLEFGPALARATPVIDGNAVAATVGIGLAASERVPVDLTDLFAQADCAAVSRQRTRSCIEVGNSMSRRPKGPDSKGVPKSLARRGQLVAGNAAQRPEDADISRYEITLHLLKIQLICDDRNRLLGVRFAVWRTFSWMTSLISDHWVH
jgi:hypothetical protein